MLSTFVLTTLVLLDQANAHGRLTVPMTRLGNPDQYENNPIAFQGGSYQQFVCRHGKNAAVTPAQYTAGDTISIRWDLSALHVGDAAVYISYDHEEPEATIDNMEFFKIANIPRARENSGTPYQITLPNWLPSGNAVLRWEWYALHVNPSMELYVQCSDIVITGLGSPTERTVASIAPETYKVVRQNNDLSWSPTTLPEYNYGWVSYNNPGTVYRNAFNPSGPQFMTGPSCAFGYQGNNCGETAVGTTGHIDMNTGAPMPPTTAAPATTTATTAAPATTSAYPSYSTTAGPGTTASTAAPATTTNGGQCIDDTLWNGSECGGFGYDGPGCCPTGLSCMAHTVWWSGCFASCPAGWLCEQQMTPPTTQAPATTASTAPATTGTTTPTSCNAGLPSDWVSITRNSNTCNTPARVAGSQCEGTSYDSLYPNAEDKRGCCAAGLTCYKYTEEWSGCYASCPAGWPACA